MLRDHEAPPAFVLPSPHSSAEDVEKNVRVADHLTNTTVQSLSWRNVTVEIERRLASDMPPVPVLSSVDGHVEAGQVLALMGPSGSGKTTLLNVLAKRTAAAGATERGEVMANGRRVERRLLRDISSYVEQDDALLGSLTVKETMHFAARLSLPSSVSKKERLLRVEALINAFGIHGQANTLVGTPIRKGISGGQKRRLSVASQLITDPKILFLDEPTSGLDSVASFEVISYIRDIAKKHRLVVVTSIHQPSTATLELFDRLLLLSGGKSCYFGTVEALPTYFASISHPMPTHVNPAEFVLDLVNADFVRNSADSPRTVSGIQEAWARSDELIEAQSRIAALTLAEGVSEKTLETVTGRGGRGLLATSLTLLHRNWIKSYRDIIAYGIRVLMYSALGIMMGTVWLRLSTQQESIQPFINAIFFGSAFMSFMAVAYVPAIIEDLHTFKRERANGLSGPLPFTLANFLIGIPYLFLITILFSVIAYWLSNFRPNAEAFWMWVMWLFLDLLAAEGLVVLITSVAPIFVVSLAVTAFANGLWMSVGGFLVPMGTLNVFWKCKWEQRPLRHLRQSSCQLAN